MINTWTNVREFQTDRVVMERHGNLKLPPGLTPSQQDFYISAHTGVTVPRLSIDFVDAHNYLASLVNASDTNTRVETVSSNCERMSVCMLNTNKLKQSMHLNTFPEVYF